MAPIFVLMEMVFLAGGKKKLYKVNSKGEKADKLTGEYEEKEGESVLKIFRNGKDKGEALNGQN